MRKLICIFAILLLIISTVSAVPPTISSEEEDSRGLFARFFSPGSFSIVGTVEQSTGGETEFQHGEIFSRQFILRWDRPSTRYEVQFYFYKNGKAVASLGTKSFNIPHEVGDQVKVTLSNIDTGLVPTQYCNEDVRLGGRHILYGQYEECDAFSGSQLPNGMTCGFGTGADMYISTTRPGQTFEDQTAGLFKILCSDVADPCLDKKGNDAGTAAYCHLGNVVKDMYTGKQLNNQCTTVNYIYRACSTACENAQCVTQLKSNGQSCMFNGQEDDNICQSDLCVFGKCDDKRNDVGGSCLNEGDCLGGLTCTKNLCVSEELPPLPPCVDCGTPPTGGGPDEPQCAEDTLCWDDKTVLMECVNGKLGDPQACPACVDNSDCGTGAKCSSGQCVEDIQVGECTSNSDCSSLYTCKDSLCVLKEDTPPTPCNVNADCSEDETCEGIQCVENISGWTKFWRWVGNFFMGLFGGG